MKRVRVTTVGGQVGDATTTGIGALGVLFLIWALSEYGHRKLSR
jgi:hypothetical protein